jgi:hypothetical protein
MRTILTLAAVLALSATAATAQTAPTPHHKKHHHATGAATGEKPVDLGPNTPEANKAYQGPGAHAQGHTARPDP